MKIATWNVNSIKVRLSQVLDWLTEQQPEILALQETKTIDENFPKQDFINAGYQVIFSGQRAYNGVAILSRYSAENIIIENPHFADPQRRILAATINNTRIINLYVPNGESLISEKFIYKMQWLKNLKHWLQQELQQYPQLVVLGDFNIAPEDRDVYAPEKWRDQVLCSEAERNFFAELIELGLQDSFRLLNNEAGQYSWWDYRNGSFWRNWGLRIDHILLSANLSKQCKNSMIDKKPRKQKQPSDHAPVVVELV